MTGTGEKILRCAQNDSGEARNDNRGDRMKVGVGRGMTVGGGARNDSGGGARKDGAQRPGTKKLSPAGERIFYQAFRISCSSFTEGRTKSGFLGAAASISLSVSPESTSTDTAPAFCATAISV